MEFTCPYRMKKIDGTHGYYLKPLTSGDEDLFDRLLKKGNAGDKTIYQGVFKLQERPRSYNQIKTARLLTAIIFQSQNERKGTKDELDDLYEDLIDAYADKVPSKFRPGQLRSVRMRAADILSAAHFIEGLMICLSETCDLPLGPQTEVRGLLTEWIAWRGGLNEDPLDQNVSEAFWREKHPYSEASGLGGQIARAHIVSRGADKADIEEPWNWIALTPSEHRLQHEAGWGAFLDKFPHLRGRYERARLKAKKLGIEVAE
jgi:hypothetical protein